LALGPIVQGAIRPSWTFTLLQSNNSPLVITGATFTGVLYDKQRATALTLTPGNFAISDGANGIFVYTPVSGDVAVPGTYEVEIALTISGNAYYIRTPDPLVIMERYAP
jgi:hypothetical protein